MSGKIKTCPYCGGRAETHCENGAFYVGCIDCFMRGPEILEVRDEAEKDAIAVWNKLPRHLQWTTETPTEPGWYFSKANSIVNVVLLGSSPEGLCVLDGEKFCLINGFSHGGRTVEWAGPIIEPQEPK